MSSHFGASACTEWMLRAVGNSLKRFRKASLARWTSSLELRYSCCFNRSRMLIELLRVARQYARESATKERKKNSVRNLKISRHPWLNVSLIDCRYPPIYR